MAIKSKLTFKFHYKTAKTGLLGMGFLGMPLAVVSVEKGFSGLGIHPDPRKVETFNKSSSYIQDVPSVTVARLKKAGS